MPHHPPQPDPFLPLGEQLDYRATLVPVIQHLLIRGLPEDLVKSSVRLGDFALFSGGLKSPLVGGLRVDLKLVVKLGDAELDDHAALMRAVNASRERTFPRVLHVGSLDDGRRFMLMEEFVGFEPLLDRLYQSALEPSGVDRLADKALELVLAVQRSGYGGPVNDDPYRTRILQKLERALAGLPPGEAEAIRTRAGVLETQEGALPCPSWRDLRRRLEGRPLPGRWEPLPIPGDPHIGNVMVRRYGRSGWGARLIDPNCTIGRTDPLYDLGKLLHWAEPVGWSRLRSWRGGAAMELSPTWRMREQRAPSSAAAEERRQRLEARIRGAIGRFADHSPASTQRLHLAVASAHLGLADLLARKRDRSEGSCSEVLLAHLRFVLLHSLRNLALGLAD